MDLNLSGEDELKKENILSRLTDYQIFVKYIGHGFDLGVVFHSPLRKDINPSFNVYRSTRGGDGNLLFKDFGIAKHGDCFQFVMEKYSLSFFECLQMINNDFNLGLSSDGYIEYNTIAIVPIQRTDKEIPVRLPTKIIIEEAPFTYEDYAYWGSYGINLDILKLFHVVRCKNSWIKKNGETKRFGGSIKGNPLYAYKDETGNVRKLYRPMTKTRKSKWRMADFNTIDCLWMLKNKINIDNVNLCILTKARKDAMVLYTLGYNSCCVEGESNVLLEETAEMLKKEYKYIVQLFDPDKAGYTGSQKTQEKFGFSRTFIQSKYCIIKKENQLSDISDVRRKYGIVKTKNLLNNILWK